MAYTDRLLDAIQYAQWHADKTGCHLELLPLLWGLVNTPCLANLALSQLNLDRQRLDQARRRGKTFWPQTELGSRREPHWVQSRADQLAERDQLEVGTEHFLSAIVDYTSQTPMVGDEPPELEGWEMEFENEARHLLATQGIERAAIKEAIASFHGCALSWRHEYPPDHKIWPWTPLDRACLVAEGTCVKLAASIRQDAAYRDLPILGDALEEAGCTDAPLLEHCRQGCATHTRWCWVVEELCGRATNDGLRT
jgi:hypothetical protein